MSANPGKLRQGAGRSSEGSADSGRGAPAARGFVGSAVAMIVAGALALLTHQPWLFPSLGPTVMLHAQKPDGPESSPRNTVIGHLVALVAGYAFLVICGLTDAPSALQAGVTVPRIVAAAGSLALTALVLALLDAAHPDTRRDSWSSRARGSQIDHRVRAAVRRPRHPR